MRLNAIFWIFISTVIVCVTWLASTYNQMVRRKNAVKNNWNTMDVQLKKRHITIKNLLLELNNHNIKNQDFIESIALMNHSLNMMHSDKCPIQKEKLINNSLNQLYQNIKKDTNLQSDETINKLLQEFIKYESSTQDKREAFNSTVTDYNQFVQSFPTSLVAKRFGFTEAELFDLDD